MVPRLPAWSPLAQLRVGEGAPSLFSPVLRSGEPGAPPPTAAEVNTGLPPVTAENSPLPLLREQMSTPPCVQQEMWDTDSLTKGG